MDLLDKIRRDRALETVAGLEDDGSMDAWYRRARNPHEFSKGTRVRTSPKRLEDPIDYGTCGSDATRDGGDWKVVVHWDDSVRESWRAIDLRALYPLETY